MIPMLDIYIEDLHVVYDESAIVESDTKGIPEGRDQIYFEESDI